jgi:hypothetical protein
MEASIQELMAAYFRGIGEWRRKKAEEYDRDVRNLRSADGLEELAEYVLSLSNDDERIALLTTTAISGGVFELEQRAHHAVSRFRFHTPETSCSAFLDHVVELHLADIAEGRRFGGRLPEGDDPWIPHSSKFSLD